MSRHHSYTIAIIFVVVLLFLLSPSLNISDYEQEPNNEAMPITVIDPHDWTSNEQMLMSSLWLDKLPPVPADPSNAVADNPMAASFGHQLFFDTRLSSNGEVSCASCHKPELKFTDGLPRAKGVGVTPRKTMTIIGTAYSPWFFWDGRKDSQWSQALGPTESAVEHGGNRTMYAQILFKDEAYRSQYESLFGTFPDLSDTERFPSSAGPVDDVEASKAWEQMSTEDQESINHIFVNIGKAIAAYERLIIPGPSRFDAYVQAVQSDDQIQMEQTLSSSEANGLHLFIGKAQCMNCHNGPLFTNNSFHNTGIPPATDLPPDFGRIEGVMQAKSDPFNCLGKYSDANQDDCPHLRYTRTEGQEIIAAFKTPTLRNVADTAPYMHSGQIPILSDVFKHYNEATFAIRGHSQLSELGLTPQDLVDLEAFLGTLSSPLATPPEYLISPWPSPPAD